MKPVMHISSFLGLETVGLLSILMPVGVVAVEVGFEEAVEEAF